MRARGVSAGGGAGRSARQRLLRGTAADPPGLGFPLRGDLWGRPRGSTLFAAFFREGGTSPSPPAAPGGQRAETTGQDRAGDLA